MLISIACAQCVDAAYCYRCSVVCVSVGLLVTAISPADAQCVDAAYCYTCSVACVFVCLSVTTMSPAETDEPIEMLFAVWTWVAPRELLSWGPGSLRGKGHLGGQSCGSF